MIGETISHYKILEKIGEGGMGVVYKAEDTKLRRTVALKFLRTQALVGEEDKARFMHEAQAAAALDHPNICTVYEVGESDDHAYISMAYVEGESLREKIRAGPISLDKALEIAVQAAEGLWAAHDKGIVHRDIKSANMMLTPRGRVKVMDFGLAKTAGATRVTRTGTMLGTAAYMSPEQALGQATDQRTDIWSLGIVLYEMLTGRLPFKGDYDPALMYSIVNEEPEPVTSISSEIPLEVEQMVGRALTKDPGKRYQNTGELVSDLEELRESLHLLPKRSRLQLRLIRRRRQIALSAAFVVVAAVLVILGLRYFTGTAQAIDSIAVLPIENISGNSEQEYKADGMTMELTAALQQIGAWTVKSSRSMMKYKGTDKSPRDIAAEVDVKALLAASIQPLSGDRVEANVELIDGATEELLWAQLFEYASSEINNLYNDIARTTCEMVGIELTSSEDARLASARPVNPEAHELYLRGKYFYFKLKPKDMKKADECFQQAIKIDPNYAKAYAGLAASYEYQAWADMLPRDEAQTKIETLVSKALEIDDKLAEAHVALSGKRFYLDWDWLGGEEEIKRAIALNPDLAEAHQEYSFFLLAMGRFEEAIAEAKRALQLDPVSYLTNWCLAYMYSSARLHDQAIAQIRQMIEMEPNDYRPHWHLSSIYERMGMYEDAIRARQQAWTLSDWKPEKVAAMVAALDSAYSAYSESGPEGYWMWHLERLKGKYDRDPITTAKYYAQLGDKEQAFAWLEKAYMEQNGPLYLLKVHPLLDPLRDDPRFQNLLRRMNFPE